MSLYSLVENVVTEPNRCFFGTLKTTACKNWLFNLAMYDTHSRGELSESIWLHVTLKWFTIGHTFTGTFWTKMTWRTCIFCYGHPVAKHSVYCMYWIVFSIETKAVPSFWNYAVVSTVSPVKKWISKEEKNFITMFRYS